MKSPVFNSITALSVLFFVSCNSTPDLTEDEVYTILNEIIADDSLYLNRVCWKFSEMDLTDVHKKEFTDQDITFINRQKILFKNASIKPFKLKSYIKRKNIFMTTTIDTACDKGILHHISFPAISADRQKVLIELQEDCNCILGGQGGKKLYEKKNGHWKRTKGFDFWISNLNEGETEKLTFMSLAGNVRLAKKTHH